MHEFFTLQQNEENLANLGSQLAEQNRRENATSNLCLTKACIATANRVNSVSYEREIEGLLVGCLLPSQIFLRPIFLQHWFM